MEFKKQNRWTQGKGRKNKVMTEREANHKRLLTICTKLRIAGGVVGGGMGIIGGWVLKTGLDVMSTGCYMQLMNH